MTKLTDEQVIRKGVELADGWFISGADYGFEPETDKADLDDIKNIRQYELDAVVAQLVRQVDALIFYDVVIKATGTDIFCAGSDDVIAQGRMSGRTMNTLRAVVESEVLG